MRRGGGVDGDTVRYARGTRESRVGGGDGDDDNDDGGATPFSLSLGQKCVTLSQPIVLSFYVHTPRDYCYNYRCCSSSSSSSSSLTHTLTFCPTRLYIRI